MGTPESWMNSTQSLRARPQRSRALTAWVRAHRPTRPEPRYYDQQTRWLSGVRRSRDGLEGDARRAFRGASPGRQRVPRRRRLALRAPRRDGVVSEREIPRPDRRVLGRIQSPGVSDDLRHPGAGELRNHRLSIRHTAGARFHVFTECPLIAVKWSAILPSDDYRNCRTCFPTTTKEETAIWAGTSAQATANAQLFDLLLALQRRPAARCARRGLWRETHATAGDPVFSVSPSPSSGSAVNFAYGRVPRAIVPRSTATMSTPTAPRIAGIIQTSPW